MPSWTDNDRAQYEAIKASLLEDGKDEERAQAIAARTVNKRRREEGRTPQATTQGTGNPHTRLEQRSRDEVYNRARQLDIPGRSTMTKAELIAAIRARS